MGRPRIRRGPAVTEAHRKAAEERQEARNARTPQQQLQRLDKLLGIGQGAKKERARLQALIDESAD
jgi:hypothetical protein